MLNYTEITNSRTIVPLSVVPSPSQRQQEGASYLSSLSSYAIGPIDPIHLTTLHIHLPDGAVYSLLMPLHLPRLILDDPIFHSGHTFNYQSEEDGCEVNEHWMTSVTGVVNHIYTSLTDARLYYDLDTGEVAADFLPWQSGWLLRDLTRLAETDTTLAAVGMAHLCLLVSLLTEDHAGNRRDAGRYAALFLHTCAVKAYRARVRMYRAQGKSFAEAQRLALAGSPQS